MAQAARIPTPPFGGLLKSWRAARKLSQLELALSSGVSQRHLSFLESGRSRPSEAMIAQLAEALEVPLRERNVLLTAAGFAPRYRESALDEAAMQAVRDALLRTLAHHDPFPAVVVDRNFDLLLENRGFSALLGLFGDVDALWQRCCPGAARNLLRLTFHPAGARPLIRNFEELAPLLLARAWRDTLGGDGDIQAFIGALREDPSLPARCRLPDLGSAAPPVLPLTLGDGRTEISLFTMISTFGTPHDVTTDEIRLETFFPADAASETLLRRLGA